MKKKKKKKVQEPKSSGIKGYIIGLIACVPFLLFGAALIKASIVEISYTRACTAETTGTVSDVSVKSERKKDSKGRHYTQYTYTAHYTYEIDGKPLSDTLVTSKKVKEGQTIKIGYVPENPKHKYVKGHDNAGNLLMMIVGIVWDALFLLIVYCIISSLKHKLSEKKKDVKADNI